MNRGYVWVAEIWYDGDWLGNFYEDTRFTARCMARQLRKWGHKKTRVVKYVREKK